MQLKFIFPSKHRRWRHVKSHYLVLNLGISGDSCSVLCPPLGEPKEIPYRYTSFPWEIRYITYVKDASTVFSLSLCIQIQHRNRKTKLETSISTSSSFSDAMCWLQDLGAIHSMALLQKRAKTNSLWKTQQKMLEMGRRGFTECSKLLVICTKKQANTSALLHLHQRNYDEFPRYMT